MKLKKLGENFKFSSEAQLEDYLWLNLTNLLNLFPLKRQLYIDNQICDILAINKKKQLFIIELKNEEDRYIVSQLTRYYSALLENKPFPESIDYNQPIKLIAITPKFHRDNFTDQKHSTLPIIFYEFILSEESNKYYFILNNLDQNTLLAKSEIIIQNESDNVEVSQPPRIVLNLLKDSSQLERQTILSLRELILTFHPKMKEFTKNKSIFFGSTISKICVEFRYDGLRKKIGLFCWLPHKMSTYLDAKIITARMRIWTDWQIVTDVGHVPKGNPRMISYEEGISNSVLPLVKMFKNGSYKERYLQDSNYRERVIRSNASIMNCHYKSPLALSFEKYQKLIKIDNISNSLDDFINLALETWLKKL